MRRFLLRFSTGMVLLGLRVAPWLVTAGAVALGVWFFNLVAPAATGGRLAAWSVAVVLARTMAALGAISAGAFALSAGLADVWRGADRVRTRRYRGLAVLGAASVAVGGFILFGRLAGFAIAHSLGVVGVAGLLAGLSAWSTWTFWRRAPRPTAPEQLTAAAAADDWLVRDLGRVKTPAT